MHVFSHVVKEAHCKEEENACRSVEIVSRSWPFLCVKIDVSKDRLIEFEQKPQQTPVIIYTKEVFIKLHQEVEHEDKGHASGQQKVPYLSHHVKSLVVTLWENVTVGVKGFIAWKRRLVGRGLRERILPSLGLIKVE